MNQKIMQKIDNETRFQYSKKVSGRERKDGDKIMIEMKNELETVLEKTAEQVAMEQTLRMQIDEIYEKQANMVNGLMEPKFRECSYEEKSLTLCFPVLEWERNRAGAMHGGMIGAAFDIAMGYLTRYLAGQNFAPTISLETVFLRPVPMGDTLVICVRANLAGRKLTHLYGEGYLESSGKLAATATASYFNEDTSERSRGMV
jgi:acyl-coenzyme A thioesterase PaaI-like protein